jgi:phage baseplate assembly protein gpV
VGHPRNDDELEAVAMKKLFGKYRGRVKDNYDPQGLGRVEVSSPAALGAGVRRWAMPCLPYAEPGVGLAMLPAVGADVWVEFEGGDPRHPIWTGFFWDSSMAPAPTDGDVVLTTRGGHRLVLSDSGSEVVLRHPGGSTVKLDSTGGVELRSSSTIRVTASKVEVRAGAVDLEAGMVKASGVVKCDTLVANSVVASSYTPGAGNVW